MNELSRRAFVGGAAAASLGVLSLGIAGCSDAGLGEPGEATSTTIPTSYSPVETYEADLVVVGSGSSGCCATMEAADLGAKVVLVEKAGAIGGMEYGTEGAFGLGSKMQLDAGVEMPDISDLMTEEMIYSNYRANPLTWRDMLAQSGATIDWLIERGQVFDRVDDYLGGSTFKCFHWWPNGTGVNFATAVQTYLADKSNATILTETEFVDFVITDGTVTGIYATNAADDVIQINAPATIMCTGGFAEDKQLVSEALGYDVSTATTFGGPADGKARVKMAAIGADITTPVSLINVISAAGHSAVDELSVATGYQAILVVNQDGERFMSEDLYTKKLFALTWNSYNAQGKAWVLFDENAITRLEETQGILGPFVVWKAGDKLTNLRSQLEADAANGSGLVARGETLAELATAMGADPEVLEATIDRYNSFCAAGLDEDFGCNPMLMHEIGDGPYYGVQPSLFYTTTIGGLRVDRNQRVIDMQGSPIPGLFSAGVESSMLYRETYNYQLSGAMNAYCYYSGRNAVRCALGVTA